MRARHLFDGKRVMTEKCGKCGAVLGENARYCAGCGANVRPEDVYKKGNDPDDLPGNVASALCYALGVISGAIFLNLEPYRKDRVIRFHAWQSIYFSLVWMGVMVMNGAIAYGLMFGFLAPFVSLGFLVIWVILMMKAYNGEKFRLPLLGDMADKQSA